MSATKADSIRKIKPTNRAELNKRIRFHSSLKIKNNNWEVSSTNNDDDVNVTRDKDERVA